MAISKTEIINKSLTLLGANSITNIDDNTNNARIVSGVYEIALKSILSECRWNFATTRKLLTSVDVDLDWYDAGETFIYAKPVNCVRIFGTNDDNATWREEGDYIISDTAKLGIRYVYYLDEPNKYPVFFVEAFVDKLASDIAFMILNSSQKSQEMLERYTKISLPKAMSENAQAGEHQYIKDDAWELAKNSNGSVDA